MEKKKIVIAFELDNENEWHGFAEDINLPLNGIAPTKEGVITQIKDLIRDFQRHEWHDLAEWQGVNPDTDIEFEYAYSVLSLFEEFDFLKIGAVAKKAGINAALLRAYACGDKNPSLAQLKKIESAIRLLGESLLNVSMVKTAQAA
jgi:hypothetical protein